MATLARTSPPQANRALADLEALGLVRKRRAGAAMLWRLRAENILIPPIRALFECERSLREDLVETIRSGLPESGVRRAILFGSVARHKEQTGSDLDLFVEVSTEHEKERVRTELDNLGTRLYQRFGIPVSLLIYSENEVKRPRNPRLLKNIEAEGIVVRGG
jgi:predicted nucleotidyltransferase